MNLWHPLVSDIVERCRRNDAEAQDEYVRVGVAQGPQQVKVILTSTLATKQGTIQIYRRNGYRQDDHYSNRHWNTTSKYYCSQKLVVQGY